MLARSRNNCFLHSGKSGSVLSLISADLKEYLALDRRTRNGTGEECHRISRLKVGETPALSGNQSPDTMFTQRGAVVAASDALNGPTRVVIHSATGESEAPVDRFSAVTRVTPLPIITATNRAARILSLSRDRHGGGA